MQINELPGAFLQDAYLLEQIIIEDRKQLLKWCAYQVRKKLDLPNSDPLPPNWKNKFFSYLDTWSRGQYESRVQRLQSLQDILKNIYTVFIRYDQKISEVKKMNDDLIAIMEQDKTTIENYSQILLNNL